LNNKSCPRGKHTPAAKDDVGPLQTEKGQHPGLGAAGGLRRDHLCNGDFTPAIRIASRLAPRRRRPPFRFGNHHRTLPYFMNPVFQAGLH
jgi:hypothetical protein